MAGIPWKIVLRLISLNLTDSILVWYREAATTTWTNFDQALWRQMVSLGRGELNWSKDHCYAVVIFMPLNIETVKYMTEILCTYFVLSCGLIPDDMIYIISGLHIDIGAIV